jgi:hypothetical protein
LDEWEEIEPTPAELEALEEELLGPEEDSFMEFVSEKISHLDDYDGYPIEHHNFITFKGVRLA